MVKHRRPRDPNELGKLIVELATGQKQEPRNGVESKTVTRARAGGLKGGKARAEKLSPEERKKIAANAAKKRWAK